MSRKKKDKDDAPAAAPDTGLRLTEHPRAQRQIRRAKGWGGLAAFALTAYLAHGAGLGFEPLLERAIPAAIAGYALAWIVAVLVWRQLAVAELEVARQRLEQRLLELEDGAGDAPDLMAGT